MKRALLPLAAGTCAVWLLALAPAQVAQHGRRPGFVNVAPRSKIPYTSNNSFAGRKYFPQPMCGGVAAFDFDNDGRTDIFFTNGAKLPELKKTDASYFNCLLRQKSDGTFEDVTARAGLAGEQLDFNLGAGRLDQARAALEAIVKQAPRFVEAHVSLAAVYYRLQRKADGDREKALAQKLTVEQRAGQSQGKLE